MGRVDSPMRKILRFPPELVFNSVLTTFSLYIFIESIRLGVGTFKKPGLGLFAFFIGLILLITSSISLVRLLVNRASSESSFSKHEVTIYSSIMIVLIGWLIVIPFLGYILVTFLATFFLSKIMGLKGWRMSLILSIETSVVSYLIFDLWLYTDLPRGIFG